jgi:cytochrome c oxidase assembly factor CtaG
VVVLLLALVFAPWPMGVIVAAVGLYGAGYRRLRRLGRRSIIGPSNAAAFAFAALALALTFGWPLASLGRELFSVHIIQHFLLFCFAGPFLIWSRAVLVLLWSLGPGARHFLGQSWARLRMGAIVDAAAKPLSSWIIFSLCFVFAQVSILYDWIAGDDLTITILHILYLLVACLFWWTVFAPFGQRKSGYREALIYAALTAVLIILIGTLIVLMPGAYSQTEAAASLRFGLSAMENRFLAAYMAAVASAFVCIVSIRWFFTRHPRA